MIVIVLLFVLIDQVAFARWQRRDLSVFESSCHLSTTHGGVFALSLLIAEHQARNLWILILFSRLSAVWSTGYQRGSLGKSHQNGDYLKQAMQKSFPSTKFEPAAFK